MIKNLFLIITIIMLAGCISVKSDCPVCPVCEETDSDTVTGSAVFDTIFNDTGAKETLVPIENVTEEDVVEEEEMEESDESDIPVKKVKEGDLVSFPKLAARDPDGDPITYVFSKPLNEKGEWQTRAGDAGEYEIAITASDGKEKITHKLLLIVESSNEPPKIVFTDLIRIQEGKVLDLQPKIVDDDIDKLSIRYEGWQTEFPYNITYQDSGEHEVTIVAYDGISESKKTIKIIVEDVNHPPKLKDLNDVVITEYDRLTIVPLAEDPDKDELQFTYGSPLDKDGRWTTKKGDAGVYNVKLTVSDGKAADSQTIKVTVKPYNRPPVLKGVEDLEISEGETVETAISAEDPEGDEITLQFTGWMTAATKKTGYNSQGVHTVTVIASDPYSSVNESFTVTVNDVNRPPVFNPGAFE